MIGLHAIGSSAIYLAAILHRNALDVSHYDATENYTFAIKATGSSP